MKPKPVIESEEKIGYYSECLAVYQEYQIALEEEIATAPSNYVRAKLKKELIELKGEVSAKEAWLTRYSEVLKQQENMKTADLQARKGNITKVMAALKKIVLTKQDERLVKRYTENVKKNTYPLDGREWVMVNEYRSLVSILNRYAKAKTNE